MILKKYLKENPKKYLIIDFDDTIAEIKTNWNDLFKQWAKIFQKYDPTFKYTYGQSLNRFVNVFVSKYGKKLKSEIVEVSNKFEQNNVEKLIPNSELIYDIKSLTNYKMFIFSNNGREIISKTLKELEIDSKFEQIISREEVMLLKPETEGVEKIMNICGDNNFNKYLYIGDSPSDRKAARRMQIYFFEVKYFKRNDYTN